MKHWCVSLTQWKLFKAGKNGSLCYFREWQGGVSWLEGFSCFRLLKYRNIYQERISDKIVYLAEY